MPSQTEFGQRRERLWPALKQSRAPAFLVTAHSNVRYLSGFTGSNGMLLLTSGRCFLFTDPRYQTQAPQESDCEVKVSKGALMPAVAAWLKRLRLRALAFEQNRISFEEYRQLQDLTQGIRLLGIAGVVETLRMVKSEEEIATIKASVQLNSAALEHALKHLKPHMTEIDLAAEIDYRMRLLGADGTAFDTIVASGPRSALPHAKPTDCAIQRDELLLIDMGASVAGYASDMTRTHAVGKLDPKKRRMYRAVLESQLAAVDAVRAGVSCATVDRAARTVLRGFAPRHGGDNLEKLFIHSTGHGLGLEIHERPRVGRKETTKLQAGMVITIEPGIYEQGVGGVRIEDTVVVTPNGCDILTPTRKELVVL